MTRSSAQRSSQGILERNSHDKVSSTIMKSSGLRTEPWWTPTFTSNCSPHQHRHSSVHWHTSPTPVPQSTPPHQVFSLPTRWPSETLNQTPSPGLQKPCWVSCWQLDTMYFSCSCLTTKIASVVLLPRMKPNWKSSIDTNCLMRPSTIVSRTFMTCSVSLRQW